MKGVYLKEIQHALHWIKLAIHQIYDIILQQKHKMTIRVEKIVSYCCPLTRCWGCIGTFCFSGDHKGINMHWIMYLENQQNYKKYLSKTLQDNHVIWYICIYQLHSYLFHSKQSFYWLKLLAWKSLIFWNIYKTDLNRV